jgi:hypothetical protein
MRNSFRRPSPGHHGIERILASSRDFKPDKDALTLPDQTRHEVEEQRWAFGLPMPLTDQEGLTGAAQG